MCLRAEIGGPNKKHGEMKRHGHREIYLEQLTDHRMYKADSKNKDEEIYLMGHSPLSFRTS